MANPEPGERGPNYSRTANTDGRAPLPGAKPRRNWWRWLAAALLGLGALGVLGLVALWQATRLPPPFYREAVRRSPAELAPAGAEFERGVLEVQNRVRQGGEWQLRVTEDQLNGWLTNDLPRKYPDALPPELSEPRVQIANGLVRCGLRFREGSIDTVLSLEGAAALTERPNEVAIEFAGMRAGLVPLPLQNALEQATQAAARSNLTLVWQQRGGNPVALLQIPETDRQFRGKRLRLERVEVRDGELYLAGRMTSP